MKTTVHIRALSVSENGPVAAISLPSAPFEVEATDRSETAPRVRGLVSAKPDIAQRIRWIREALA